MCGIYGIVDRKGECTPSPELLSKMAGVLVHRGPDDEGHHVEKGVALGMRRLSIIDLAGGHQPIPNETETVWAICNGEIYNFPGLRADLEARGHVFRCNSDTEVIVHLYEEEGLEFLQRLRGMFALALWDRPRARLVLARDRLGKKPLYVRREPHRLLFASEIKAILQDHHVPRRIEPQALHEYLALGYVPAPLSIFEGIEKVLPGHYLMVEQGRIEDRQYWDVRFDQVETGSEEEWVQRVRDKLLECVRTRLVSDVPLGAFLSGGIDSSAIVAAMARLIDQPVKTYSIGFAGEDQFYNELPYARVVANAFGTEHHEIIVRPQVSELLPKLLWYLDEPIADSAFITTYLVSQLARESVTVVLSGVGGDELFGGYRRYLGDAFGRYYRLLPPLMRRRWLPALLGRLPQDRHSGWKNYIRFANAFVKSAEWVPALRYMSYVTLFSPEVRAKLLEGTWSKEQANGHEPASHIMQEYFHQCRDADRLNQIIYVDLKTSLPDDLLALTDKMSMAASIECRAPFVDHELIELTSHMPSHFKVRGLSMKYLLKKVVKPWLPDEILRRKKRGFGAPIGAWLRRDLDGLVQETLSEEQVRRRGLFHWPVVRELIINHQAQRSDCTDQLLALINLELWCRNFLDGSDWQYAPATQALLSEH
ncbi:MAG: asparagine synthase (glutamine-hydrolyzing) [Candidatus Entotheonellia bacterium]